MGIILHHVLFQESNERGKWNGEMVEFVICFTIPGKTWLQVTLGDNRCDCGVEEHCK